MSSARPFRAELAVEWLAPPFAGHLFPLITLASALAARGFARQRVVSTPGAEHTVRAAGLDFRPVLAREADRVFAIANTARPVSGAPHRMLRQLRANLELCGTLRAELAERWRHERPDVAIVDFTLPVAGLLARELGARWWTTTPSPCAIETRTGTPAYVGGWRDHGVWWSRTRDRIGNLVVHAAKRGLARCVRRELRALGVGDIHRADGTEVVYSDERLFALGAREFELRRDDWPSALEFIGPVFASAPGIDTHGGPPIEPGRVHVLISLGTHLMWAKRRAAALTVAAARRLPEWRFHFTLGKPRLGEHAPSIAELGLADVPRNWTVVDYLPYDTRLAAYDLALVHGGTGVTYACLACGVPLLVWPHDYDQFDHAVRIEATGAGIALRPKRLVEQLVALQRDEVTRAAARRMQAALGRYDPVSAIEAALAAECAD